MIVFGIDPGLTGGVACIDTRTRKCSVHDLPTTPLEGGGLITKRVQGRELGLMLRRLHTAGEDAVVYLELVGAMGGKNNAMQIQASLAGTYLGIRCVLDVLQLKQVLVTPQKWKASFGLKRDKEERDSAYKRRHLELARRMYPDADLPLAKDHNKAESLLIAHYGMLEIA